MSYEQRVTPLSQEDLNPRQTRRKVHHAMISELASGIHFSIAMATWQQYLRSKPNICVCGCVCVHIYLDIHFDVSISHLCHTGLQLVISLPLPCRSYQCHGPVRGDASRLLPLLRRSGGGWGARRRFMNPMN